MWDVLALVGVDIAIVLFEIIFLAVDEHAEEDHHALFEGLHWITVAIYAIFVVEVFTKLFAYGKRFFKWVNIIEATIIFGVLVLLLLQDTVFHNISDGDLVSGLVGVVRVIIVVNGFREIEHLRNEQVLANKERLIDALERVVCHQNSVLS